jgi:uncharacterized protein YgbK (DUF1537 family)
MIPSSGKAMILCLGDDLTGITEVAGLAVEKGIQGMILVSSDALPEVKQIPEGIVYVNLACRALDGEEAQRSLIRVIQHFYPLRSNMFT